MAKRRLGSGIDDMFSANLVADEAPKNAKTTLKISHIEPKQGQPRKTFENEPLSQLADSIAAFGVLQPILVREIASDRYQIVAGERRWRASRLAGLDEIPAIIIDGDEKDAAQIAIIENVQREDLNPLEEAEAYRSLAEEYNMTQEELSARIGKSRSAIANSMRLLDLPDEVLAMVASKDITAGHARTLLGLRADEDIITLARQTVAKGWSVRALEDEVRKFLRRKKAEENGENEQENDSEVVVDYAKELERRMQNHLGRRVKISLTGKQKTVTLYFEDNEDLDNLLRDVCGERFNEEA
jgi:ParB family chromosome partitioning protein